MIIPGHDVLRRQRPQANFDQCGIEIGAYCAIVPTVRLNLTMTGVGLDPDIGPGVYGLGTTDFKMKWRFLEEDPQGWCPPVFIAPKVTIPTACADRCLGDGFWRAQLPIKFGKTKGDWCPFAEAGYQWAFDDSAGNAALWGVGTLYNFSKHFAAGAELYGLIPIEQQAAHTFAATVGAVYTFNANWPLKDSISQSLRDEMQPGPQPAGVFFVVWNF